MPSVNNGTPIRFKNGGQMGFGSSGSRTGILNWEGPGIVTITQGMTAGIPFKSGSSLASPAGIIDGDDMPTEIDINVRYASSAAVNELLALFYPAASSGLKAFFTFSARFPRYKSATGANTAEEFIWTRCWCPERAVITPGEDYDLLKVKIQHYGPKVDPVWVDNSSTF